MAFNRFFPFSEASCRRLLDICSFSDTDSFVSNVEEERAPKGSEDQKTKGTDLQGVCDILPFCAWLAVEWKRETSVNLATWWPSAAIQAADKHH